MARNYYVILGIPQNATQEQIKTAYRHHAKILHPDHYGDDHTPFLEVQEAYHTLINPEKRKQYDRKLDEKECAPKSPYKSRRRHSAKSPIEPNEPCSPGQRFRSPSPLEEVEQVLFRWFTEF